MKGKHTVKAEPVDEPVKGEPRVKIEPKNEEGEEKRQTSRKRKSSQPYTAPVDVVKGRLRGVDTFNQENAPLISRSSLTIQLIDCSTTS